MTWFRFILNLILKMVGSPLGEGKTSGGEKKMPLDFDSVKDAAIAALKDAGAKEELEELVDEYKDLFVDEGKEYLMQVVEIFKGPSYNPEKYQQMLEGLGDEELAARIRDTADEIAGLVKTVHQKKRFIKDLKKKSLGVVKRAAVAMLATYLGPLASVAMDYVTE